MFFRLLRKLLPFCLLLLFWATAAQAVPTPAATVISNTATGSFVDSVTGLSGAAYIEYRQYPGDRA
ncbi:hypothetical protein LP414_11710 [Polaromonas sp. P1(28)-13]|nr:hypothetical protein LP414_11710 [Polaromonas sp. P1(28)-13]